MAQSFFGILHKLWRFILDAMHRKVFALPTLSPHTHLFVRVCVCIGVRAYVGPFCDDSSIDAIE